jgi:hypothetical protein
MKRRWTLALAGILALPGAAAAQSEPPMQNSRVSITPFLGARVGYTATGQMSLSTPDGAFSAAYEEDRAGAGATGAEIDVHAWGPISVVGSLAYSRAGRITVTEQTEQGVSRGWTEGPTVWFAKAAVSVRLPEPEQDTRRFRPVAFLSAGPALVREDYEENLFLPTGMTKPVDSWALNIGAKAVAPLWSPRIAFMLGLEDYITFWNDGEWERRLTDLYAGPSDLDYQRSHILMLRTGMTFRF